MTSCLKLRELFKGDEDFAWRLLQAECQVHTKRDICIHDITTVSELYMKAVQKLNSIQDQRQKYFTQKMQQLMAKPFVIRCFNNENQGKKNQMQFKRKQIQQILFHENQKANPQRLHHMLSQYGQKQKKLKQRIDKIMQEHQKNLQQRLKKRASLKPDNRLSYSSQIFENDSGQKSSSDKKECKKRYNPSNSRSTTGSSYIQLNSP